MSKYFTEKLIAKNIDVSNIFPEKQETSRISNGVSYSLADIVLYLKESTNDFKSVDNQFIDIDSAIEEIVKKYYISIGEKNPFEETEALASGFKSKTPREAIVVDDGKTKGKGAPKSAPEIAGTKTEDALVKGFKNKEKAEKKEGKAQKTEESDKIKVLEMELETMLNQVIDLDYDEEDKKPLIDVLKIKKESEEVVISMADTEEEENYHTQRAKLYSTYIKKLEKV